jgi:hypothetical protein
MNAPSSVVPAGAAACRASATSSERPATGTCTATIASTPAATRSIASA